MTTDLIDSGVGEEGRLQFILECIDKNKQLYKTDIKFLESLTKQFDLKIKRLNGDKNKNIKNTAKLNEKYDTPKTLLSDERLDEHLDKIESKKNTKISHTVPPSSKEKKSFFRRIFSK